MTSKEPCLCSTCILETYLNERNEELPGDMQPPKIRYQHKLADAKRAATAKHSQAAAEVVEESIMLATMDTSYHRSETLPVRQRDQPTPLPVQVRGAEPATATTSTQADPSLPDMAKLKLNDMPDVKERLTNLSLLESQLHHRSRLVPNHITLTFSSAPKTSLDPLPSLSNSKQENRDFEMYKGWIADEQARLTSILLPIGDRNADQRRAVLLRRLQYEERRLLGLLDGAWDRAKIEARLPGFYFLSDTVEPLIIRPPPPPVQPRRDPQPFLIAALIMISVLHAITHVSRPHTSFALATVKAMVLGAIMMSKPRGMRQLGPADRLLLSRIPADVRTVMKSLQLEPQFTVFAACPTCFTIYAPSSSADSSMYPRTCLFTETDRPLCGADLLQERCLSARRRRKRNKRLQRGDQTPSGPSIPIRPYLYYSIKSWIAAMLARPRILELMKKGWEGSGAPEEGPWKDIMDTPAMRTFLGPDGRTLFSVQADNAVHLVFSLFIDWFNPYGNKQAGKSHSIGAIYLVCHNLPPHLRYRPKNVYLAGIIPGPHEPRLHQLNHLLRPLVDELLELWQYGILLEEAATSLLSSCVVRAAVIPLVCDLPALRKTAGFAGHSARHFCSFCPLPREEIGNVERDTWPCSRSWSEHLKTAQAWKDAPTEAERNRIFQEHGLRWSELLRLPYWDPTKFALVDAMHNLFLGELHHHCLSIWGMKTAEARDKRPSRMASHSPEMQLNMLTRIAAGLREGSESAVASVRKDYLEAVVAFNRVVVQASPTKAQYASALMSWVANTAKGVNSLRLPPVYPDATDYFRAPTLPDSADDEHTLSSSVFSAAVLNTMQRDIQQVHMPTWLPKPPRNFGSASHGKLKADQWRTACSVNMVITLVRLWGVPTATEKEKQALENFMHLVAAVDLTVRRSMTVERAAAFEQHMVEYLHGLRSLYDAHLVPNHHLSLHLVECLLLFGPTHAWWSFPFERYNGLLQRMKTNYKPEDMPKTFLRYFYVSARLRWVMNADSWPEEEEFQDIVKAFNAALDGGTRGTSVMDALSFGPDDMPPAEQRSPGREETLERAIYDELLRMINSLTDGTTFASRHDKTRFQNLPFLPHTAESVPYVKHSGVTFSTNEHSLRNSFVLYTRGGANITAGRINSIFHHTRVCGSKTVVDTFLVMDEFAPLSAEHELLDPYRRFPDIHAWLCYNCPKGTDHVIRLADVVSHFAAYVYTPPEIGQECLVVKSLDRA